MESGEFGAQADHFIEETGAAGMKCRWTSESPRVFESEEMAIHGIHASFSWTKGLGPTMISLWDYGWLSYTLMHLQAGRSPEAMVKQYLGSPYFTTSFLPPHAVAPGIHGPFKQEAISTRDFQVLSGEGVLAEIEKCRQPEGFKTGADDIQWRPVLKLCEGITSENEWFWKLLKTEKDKKLHHEWGSVLTPFREFIAGAPNKGNLHRLVISLD
ncbi:MAG: hypothetical protein HY077_01415 [Elusimicrobia bacterium]|nr:hypothetical protein [Elusimicrobiota bacterium]